jgi:hypothetical protein
MYVLRKNSEVHNKSFSTTLIMSGAALNGKKENLH